MKNKLLIAVLLLSVLLGGCGDSGDSSSAVVDNTDTWEDDSEYEETDMDYEEDTYEESEEVVVATYPFTKIYPFSEGKAWVNFDKDGIICTGIIDTDGNLLYESESEFFYVSQFKDGTAFYRENQEETSPCGIIDLDGNVLFDSQITSDGGYLILGYGEGHFFVVQHIQNFDVNEWYYGTIDKNGKILNELKIDTVEEKPERELISRNLGNWIRDKELCSIIKYIGENCIAFPGGLYNISTGNFASFEFSSATYHSYYAEAVGDFQNGYAGVILEGLSNPDYIIINKDYTGSLDVDRIISTGSIYSEGLMWIGGYQSSSDISTNGYYDKDWNLIIPLEQYSDIEGGPFHDGYAAVKMTGADNEKYVAVIGKDGGFIYSPIKVSNILGSAEANIYINLNDSLGGYLQVVGNEGKKIVGPDGTIYTPGVDDLSMLEGLTFGDISNGFIIMGSEEDSSDTTPYYVSLDTNTIIDSVKVTSTSMDIIEDESWDEETSEDTSYIVPDSYDITGKWKSVGDSGFGQAQPGAIVTFDGNNCNFYSPNDTYAFYKEDDRYVLNITSVLGESLSQTVNIIDDDNIEIAGASLQRME